jgi:hypothetical protein
MFSIRNTVPVEEREKNLQLMTRNYIMRTPERDTPHKKGEKMGAVKL